MRVALLLVAVTWLLTLPASASAWDLTYDGTRYVFVASDGEANDLTTYFTSDGTKIGFDDSYAITGADTYVNDNCELSGGSDTSHVLCPVVPNPAIALGDGNDKLASGTRSADLVDLGPGNDRAVGGEGDDFIAGGPGDDLFSLARDAGGDTVIGEEGHDTASYDPHPLSGRESSISVTLDGQANDGDPGEGDNVEVDRVISGPAADTLVGGEGPDAQLARPRPARPERGTPPRARAACAQSRTSRE